MSYDQLQGIVFIIGLILYAVAKDYMNYQHIKQQAAQHGTVIDVLQAAFQSTLDSVVDALKVADSSSTTLNALQGATSSISPDSFSKVQSTLATAELFSSDQVKQLETMFSKLVQDVQAKTVIVPVPLNPGGAPQPGPLSPYVPTNVGGTGQIQPPYSVTVTASSTPVDQVAVDTAATPQ